MTKIRHGRLEALQLDLFGEVPVSLDDVLLWMLAVPRLAPTSPRFPAYVRDYRVPEKIRAAKLAGTFEATVAIVLSPTPGAAESTPAAPPHRLARAAQSALRG